MRRYGTVLLIGFLGLFLFVPYAQALSTKLLKPLDSDVYDMFPCVNTTHDTNHVADFLGDAHVKNGSLANYGSDVNLIFGNYTDGGYYETYMRVDLGNASNIVSVSLSFTYHASSQGVPFNISLYSTSTGFNQNLINSNNAPTGLTYRGNVTVSPIPVGIPFFKFRQTFSYNSSGGLTLCLKVAAPQAGGYIVGPSQEGAGFKQEKPLVEYVTRVITCDKIPGFDNLLILGFSAIAICILIVRFKKASKTSVGSNHSQGGFNR